MFKYSFYSCIAAALLGFAFVPADEKGYIKVTLQDAATSEAIPFSVVELRKDSCGFVRTIAKSTTNMDGETFFKDLDEGAYQVWSTYIGYHAALMKEIKFPDNKRVYITLRLRFLVEQYCEDVFRYTPPVPVDPDTKTGRTTTQEEYHDIFTQESVRFCSPQREYEPAAEIAPPVEGKSQPAQPSKKQKPRKAK